MVSKTSCSVESVLLSKTLSTGEIAASSSQNSQPGNNSLRYSGASLNGHTLRISCCGAQVLVKVQWCATTLGRKQDLVKR